MPAMQKMSERANALFNRDRINDVDVKAFNINPQEVGASDVLATIAASLKVAETPDEKKYLKTWPAALQEALRAALLSALNRKPRLPVTISWAPGYDYEIDIWEARSTTKSAAAMTILLRSKYPDA
jgi:hypothetical protein